MASPRAGPRVADGIAAIATTVCCTVQLLHRPHQSYKAPAFRALIRPGIPIHRRPAIVYNQGRGAVFRYLRNRAVALNQPFVIPFQNGPRFNNQPQFSNVNAFETNFTANPPSMFPHPPNAPFECFAAPYSEHFNFQGAGASN